MDPMGSYGIHLPKANMTMEKQSFEDVFQLRVVFFALSRYVFSNVLVLPASLVSTWKSFSWFSGFAGEGVMNSVNRCGCLRLALKLLQVLIVITKIYIPIYISNQPKTSNMYDYDDHVLILVNIQQIYMHTYITFHYITSHYITSHYITLHYIHLFAMVPQVCKSQKKSSFSFVYPGNEVVLVVFGATCNEEVPSLIFPPLLGVNRHILR